MSKVLRLVRKYGPRAVRWVKNHRGTILHWLDIGQ